MTDPKGPTLDIPEELQQELERSGEDASDAGEAVEVALESPVEGEVAGISNEELEALRTEIAELKDRRLREAAEYQNQRRRLLKEQQDALNYANENLIKEVLETVDNLERALGHVRQGEDEGGADQENLQQGVELTLRSLLNVLDRNGVSEVDTDGSFDPRYHEAMRQIPSADREPGEIVEVYQKGYVLKGRLLRAAMVAVASEAPKEP